ncbi:MAG: N(4)-(beta-N-acetylglucosaminyl)-L-asparaginase [Candidatus Aminicenantes bacterium]|nr:N(4)-(beta-N-acetylglucosaminyl)-L-asparaginase [Candidatus Aminicenantes bacterium]
MKRAYARREFLKTGVAAGAASLLAGRADGRPGGRRAASGDGAESGRALAPPPGPVVVASGNGLRATDKAMELLRGGASPLEAVIAGVNIVEDDPEDITVGYGGLPNEDGVVELDASVMSGPAHAAGAVAALRNIKNPSRVARLVMERSDHALLVGEGALRFAKAHGFVEENLLTDKARRIWLKWKETLSDRDNWFPPKPEKAPAEIAAFVASYGTINCVAIDARGDLAGVTTTSGLAFKLAGRVGDSPIIGAGLYVDNEVGAAGSTGRGEANILNCGSFTVVEFMRRGLAPEDACREALKRIIKTTGYQPHLLDAGGRPGFGLNFYAINKKGEFGSASLWSGQSFAVHDGTENRLIECPYVYEKKKG